ncbi:SDK1 [Branchiostoma lanceolatum]|uniref:SDK1 protein n=1 Tax=Branchiostoma lanceolatum TaxID=7740 RepID=A0A8K0ECG2_BRALA|nr:SDK1 [Branchiostoma lanceolatum]
MTRRERSKVKAMQEHTYIPIILCILTGIQTTNASLGLSCTVCSETHPELNITCTWDTQPGVSYSPFFKLQLGTSCTSYTTWQVCSSSAEGTCQIPFLHCESTFDRFEVKVETSDSEAQTISFYKNEIAKPHPPEELTAHADSSTQITVGWKMPECTDMMFNSYTCQVEYTSQQNITRTSETSVDFNPEASKELRNLTPYTLYRVRVRCKPVLGALDGWGEFTNTVEAQTHAAAPSRGPHVQTPEDVWLDYRKGLRNVSIQWQDFFPQALSTTDYNGVLQGYRIRVRDLRTDEVTELTVNNSGAQSYTYTLGNLKLSGYQVNITAYNAEGQSPPRTRFINDIARKPDPPRDLAAMATSDNNLQLSWQPPADVGGIETYVILWCELETDVTCAGPEKNRTVAGSELSIKVIDSWRPLTRYIFAVKAVNSAGQSETSNTAAGYTVQGVPSSPPQNVTVEAETPTSLLVSWKPPPLQDRRGIITKYRVYYYVTPTVSGQRMAPVEQSVAVNITDDSQPVQFSLSGLEPFTSYRVRLSAVTSQGKGNKTQPTGAQTSQAAPSDPPTDVQISDVTVNSVALSWTPPSRPNGIIRYYIIKHEHGNDTRSEGNHTTFVLEGLEGDTDYAIQVQGCTAADVYPCGPLSPEEHVQTKVGAPGNVQDLQAQFDPTDGDVSVSWNPPALKNGRDISYIVSYRRKDLQNDDTTVTSTTYWTNDKLDDTCSDGLELLFTVYARTRDPETGQLFDGPVSTERLSCDDRPGVSSSSRDIQKDRLTLEAKVGIILAALVACMVGLAALVPTCRKMYKKTKNDVPGPADFITDSNQGIYSSIPDLPRTLNNLHIVSEQTGKTPEIMDDFSKLRVERQWSHDSAFGSDYGNNNVDFNVVEQKAHYSVGGSSSGYSDLSDENATLQSDTNKAENSVSNNQQSDVADYSKLDVDDNFKDLKVNYVTKQDSNTVSPEGSKNRHSTHSSTDNLETITDYSKVAAEKDHKKDLDVSYVRNTGTKGNTYGGVQRSEQSSPKHADIPYTSYRESPGPVKCKIVCPEKVPYVTYN